MKTIHVLGTAPSIKNYKTEGYYTIGVNTIWQHVKTGAILLTDPPEKFTTENREIIENSKPGFFFTQLPQWKHLHNYLKINVDYDSKGSVKHLDDYTRLPMHVDSTFTAVCMAYHLLKSWPGPKQIILYGTEFTNHPILHQYVDIIQQAYKNLMVALIDRHVKFYIGNKDTALYNIIPFYYG